MRRTTIRIEDVAARDHLAWAFWRAARCKRGRQEVQRFAADLDRQLEALQGEILNATVPVGATRRFEIRDPKRRSIHAPLFRERVLHHALMAHLAPVFERYLIADTFACRPGKGSSAAVRRAQQLSHRFPWYLKMDVRSYFASIDHEILRGSIRRRIRGAAVLGLCDRIVEAHEASPGRGLPIGSLTSQHFANLYLAALDRFLLEEIRVGGLVRYMDDLVVWGGSREELRVVLKVSSGFARDELRLEIKPSWQLQRSERGLPLCGYRVFTGRLRLSRRRRRRHAMARRRWEGAYESGAIGGEELQAGYASALAITAGADALAWRRRQLAWRPPVEA